MIETWQITAVGVGAVFQTWFVLRYFYRPWWKSFVGRAIFAKAMSLMVLLNTQIQGVFFPAPHQEVIDSVALTLVAAAVVWQAVALEVQAAREKRGDF